MTIRPRCGFGTHEFAGVGEITGRWFSPTAKQLAEMECISVKACQYDVIDRRGTKLHRYQIGARRFACIDFFKWVGGRWSGKFVPDQLWVELYPCGPRATMEIWGDNRFVAVSLLWTRDEDSEFAAGWEGQ